MSLQHVAFPKCYIEQIAGNRTLSVFDWIDMARSLDADGLEMYDGFFTSLDDRSTCPDGSTPVSSGLDSRLSLIAPIGPDETPTCGQSVGKSFVSHRGSIALTAFERSSACEWLYLLKVRSGLEWRASSMQTLTDAPLATTPEMKVCLVLWKTKPSGGMPAALRSARIITAVWVTGGKRVFPAGLAASQDRRSSTRYSRERLHGAFAVLGARGRQCNHRGWPIKVKTLGSERLQLEASQSGGRGQRVKPRPIWARHATSRGACRGGIDQPGGLFWTQGRPLALGHHGGPVQVLEQIEPGPVVLLEPVGERLRHGSVVENRPVRPAARFQLCQGLDHQGRLQLRESDDARLPEQPFELNANRIHVVRYASLGGQESQVVVDMLRERDSLRLDRGDVARVQDAGLDLRLCALQVAFDLVGDATIGACFHFLLFSAFISQADIPEPSAFSQ